MFALALAAAMPAAQAIGKSKACDDPVHCFALDVFGDTCQSVREEATTPNGADVALYPQSLSILSGFPSAKSPTDRPWKPA